jgi:hypothetical protein
MNLDIDQLSRDLEKLEKDRLERFARIDAHPVHAWMRGDLASLRVAMFIAYGSEPEYWSAVILRWFRMRGTVKRRVLARLAKALRKRSVHHHRGRLERFCWAVFARCSANSFVPNRWMSAEEAEDLLLKGYSEAYVRRRLAESLRVRPLDIPGPMVEAKRVHLRLTRLLRKEKRV